MNEKYKIIEKSSELSSVNITDENGISTQRIIDNDKIFYTLATENKMELVGLKKDEINKEINAALSRLDLLKYTVPLYPIVIATVGGFLILVKIFKPEAIASNSWLGLVGAVTAGEASVATVAIVEHLYNKKEIKTLKEQLKALERYEKEPIIPNPDEKLDEFSFQCYNQNMKCEINEILGSFTKKKKKENKKA